jgi:sensor domain CHASE-containing protein
MVVQATLVGTALKAMIAAFSRCVAVYAWWDDAEQHQWSSTSHYCTELHVD